MDEQPNQLQDDFFKELHRDPYLAVQAKLWRDGFESGFVVAAKLALETRLAQNLDHPAVREELEEWHTTLLEAMPKLMEDYITSRKTITDLALMGLFSRIVPPPPPSPGPPNPPVPPRHRPVS